MIGGFASLVAGGYAGSRLGKRRHRIDAENHAETKNEEYNQAAKHMIDAERAYSSFLPEFQEAAQWYLRQNPRDNPDRKPSQNETERLQMKLASTLEHFKRQEMQGIRLDLPRYQGTEDHPESCDLRRAFARNDNVPLDENSANFVDPDSYTVL